MRVLGTGSAGRGGGVPTYYILNFFSLYRKVTGLLHGNDSIRSLSNGKGVSLIYFG